MEKITFERVQEYHKKETKRICFATTHKNALKPNYYPLKPYAGTFNVPFGETIRHLFPFTLFPNKRSTFHPEGFWYSIPNKEEFTEIRSWKDAQNGRLFLRDCLYTSIALSMNMDAKEKVYTIIGNLENLAKKGQDDNATRTLSSKCVEAIQSYALYLQADYIAAVPPSKDKDPAKDLPSRIAALVSKQINKPDITSSFQTSNSKTEVKLLPVTDRWNEWEQTGLNYNGKLTGKTVILIDDKYQSGTSIQYVAMKLQEAGAEQIYGLCLVKTMRDTDNQ